MSTQNILQFLESTMHSLSTLANKITDIRYDLIGSVPTETPVAPATPRPEFGYGEASFETGVEHLSNRINEHMSTIERELACLRDNVNHKAKAPTPAPPYSGTATAVGISR